MRLHRDATVSEQRVEKRFAMPPRWHAIIEQQLAHNFHWLEDRVAYQLRAAVDPGAIPLDAGSHGG